MNKSEDKVLTLQWSTVSSRDTAQSIVLPTIVRTFEDYAKVDFAIGDNDPVYFAVRRARDVWGRDWAARFCVGMLAYYHMGTAVKAAEYEGAAFWDYLEEQYNTAPRGAARRHFRGSNGAKGLASMRAFAADPVQFFDNMPDTYLGIKELCQTKLAQFGPYFWLKIADYMDRCLGEEIDYDGLQYNLSTVPAKATQILYPKFSIPEAFELACRRLYNQGLLAPPTYERLIGPAEVETILCDWLHAKQGTNWLGADLITKREALFGYGDKAAQMNLWLPPVVPKGTFTCELL